MKKYLIFIFDLSALIFGKAFAIICSYRMRQLICLFRNRAFSYSIEKQFKQFGKGTCVSHNVRLINPCYISIGNGTSIDERTVLSAWDCYENDRFTPEIMIGDNTSIGSDCHITAINRIVIGNGVLIGKNITISDNSHGSTTTDQLDIPPIKRRMVSTGPVIIDDNVWIGDKATILPGVHIGLSSIIAANAVVTCDVPTGCIAAGIPAKIIKNIMES
jgi:acetyltransferase-like isoleucine patch superfamily enzyme